MFDWFCFYEPDYRKCWHAMIKAEDILEAKSRMALLLSSYDVKDIDPQKIFAYLPTDEIRYYQ